jgi:hypothetical protein
VKKSIALKIYLIVSGLLLTIIGGATLIDPVTIKASSGIDLAGNTNLLNDVRATGSLILTIALLTLSGAYSPKLRYTASIASTLLFISLGLGRIVSIINDGMPYEGIVKATGLEMVLGIIGAILFFIFKNNTLTSKAY